MVNPDSTDKVCRAKIAVLEALDKLEYKWLDALICSVLHVKFEPVWGGRADSAAPLRLVGLLGLARMDYRGLLPVLVDALTGPEKMVRIVAVQGVGCHGSESANLLLRLKARTGDSEPNVTSECLVGLLTQLPGDSLAFAAEFLNSRDEAVRHAAVMALGRSRLPRAFELLKTLIEPDSVQTDSTIFVAIGMLRIPAANEFLHGLIASGSEPNASAALTALLVYRYDPSLRQALVKAVQKSGRREFQDRIERDLMGQ